jgi:hypothetical protein
MAARERRVPQPRLPSLNRNRRLAAATAAAGKPAK